MRRTALICLCLSALATPAAAQMFGRAPNPDLNGDGHVTAAEYRKSQADSLLGSFDKNKDGQISRAEFKALEDMARRFGGQAGAGRVAAMWTQMDADRNGMVNRAEIEAAADRRFATADLDRDGRLDKVELTSLRQGRASAGK